MKTVLILKNGTLDGKPVHPGEKHSVEADFKIPPWMREVKAVDAEHDADTLPGGADAGGVDPELKAARERADKLGVTFRKDWKADTINTKCDAVEAKAKVDGLRKQADALGIQWTEAWTEAQFTEAIADKTKQK